MNAVQLPSVQRDGGVAWDGSVLRYCRRRCVTLLLLRMVRRGVRAVNGAVSVL